MNYDTLDKSINLALEASAGTGKTFQLSMRVVGMVLNNVPLQDILCLTFTNKATDEMLDRVVSTLSGLASGTADAAQTELLVNLMKKYRVRKDEDYGYIDLQKDAKTSRDKLLEEFSSLKIKTIDSFSNTILRIFPFEAQLRPDYAICSEKENEELTNRAFYSVMETLLKEEKWREVFENFSDIMEQNQSKTIENLLEYADFSRVRRIELQLPLKKDLIPPDEIYASLIDAKKERENAIEKIHAFADALGKKTLIERQENVKNKLEEMTLVRQAVAEKILYYLLPSDHSYFKKTPFSSEELTLHAEIKNHISAYLASKGAAAKALSLSLGGFLYGELKKLKNEKNVLTYTDICERAFDILVESKNIDNEYLYFRLDARISHILIDEFQDTSVPQWLILRPLAEEAMAGVGQYDKSGSFFFVGDPKQNLYRFRGGSSALFRNISENYSNKLIKDTLDINYRSGKNIVEAVNIIFNTAAETLKDDELDIFKIKQKTPENREDGYISITLPEKDGAKDKDFTIFCVKKVNEAIIAGFTLSDIAVLVPTNKDGLAVKNALTEADIPVRLETSGKLLDTGVFKATLALAEFIETKNDFAFLEYALTEDLAFPISKYSSVNEREKIKAHILQTAAAENCKTIFEKLLLITKDAGLQKRFLKEPDFIQTLDIIATSAGDETNIAQFIEKVKKTAVDKLSLTAGENKAVSVMTVHKSKGLQFPCVILPKLDFNIQTDAKSAPFILTENISGKASFEFVHTKACAPFLNEKQTDALTAENALVMQDSLNKLYVAFTRAEEALIARAANPKEKEGDEKNISQLLNQFITIPYEKGALKPYGKKQPQMLKNYTVPEHYRILEPKISIKRETQGDYQSAVFGTTLHSGAFLLNGFTEIDAENAFIQAIATNGAVLNDKDKKGIRNYVQLLASNDHWQKLFEGKIFRERKVATDKGLYSIDFYALFTDKVILIEYKTGEITPDIYADYEKQLHGYAAILKKLYGLKVEKYIYHFHNERLDIRNI